MEIDLLMTRACFKSSAQEILHNCMKLQANEDCNNLFLHRFPEHVSLMCLSSCSCFCCDLLLGEGSGACGTWKSVSFPIASSHERVGCRTPV
ncbi:hypothetical protein AVEN_127153-1 [Araneus ventricosus]|uniref:Uncharacterized protein n=1 Tax=Araneus ventricosus TaxID=182803 RepID=A0A4Y2IPS4_ARAVE|nr:hypothetical protein AVEN_127153-1 [Araneus ventricosus]